MGIIFVKYHSVSGGVGKKKFPSCAPRGYIVKWQGGNIDKDARGRSNQPRHTTQLNKPSNPFIQVSLPRQLSI